MAGPIFGSEITVFFIFWKNDKFETLYQEVWFMYPYLFVFLISLQLDDMTFNIETMNSDGLTSKQMKYLRSIPWGGKYVGFRLGKM